MESESQLSRGFEEEYKNWGEELGRARTTLTSPGGCDKSGMGPLSSREIWPPANVNALEKLMHRTLICSSSARWRHVWEKGRFCEQIPNTLQVRRKLRACFLLQGRKGHSCSESKVERTLPSSHSSVGETWDGTSRVLRAVPVPSHVASNNPLPSSKGG